jgi:hypothetical protein
MRWFRQHVRQGSWFALLALAINFTLAFGHVHAPDGSEHSLFAAVTAPGNGQGNGQGQNHPADHADYLCPICMASAAMGTALVSVPPALPVRIAVDVVEQPLDHFTSAPQPRRASFESRGPPIS